MLDRLSDLSAAWPNVAQKDVVAFSILPERVAEALNSGQMPTVATVTAGEIQFEAVVRIDTPKEADYFRHGGILPYVLRQLASVG